MLHRAFVPCLLAAGLLAGCGPAPVWTKPDATAELTASDVQACRMSARQEAWRNGFYGWSASGIYYPVGSIGPGWSRGRMFADRSWEEDRLADYCMRVKGYTLTNPPA